MNYWIIGDVGSDLGSEFISVENKLDMLPMEYDLGDEARICRGANDAEIKELYDKIREGKLTKTSQVNQESYYSLFKKISEKGEAIICLTLSSGVSGTYSSANLARNLLLEEMPTAKIEVIDSKSASLGFALILRYVRKFRDNGNSFEKCAEFAKNLVPHIEHLITISDLKHLMRGGRLSKGTAIVGTLLKIQPFLHIDENGKLLTVGKQSGRKRAIKELCDQVEARAVRNLKGTVIESVSGEKQDIIIGHSDCIDDAVKLKEMLSALDFIGEIEIMPIGCVIGAHTGPSTLTVFFYGEKRTWSK